MQVYAERRYMQEQVTHLTLPPRSSVPPQRALHRAALRRLRTEPEDITVTSSEDLTSMKLYQNLIVRMRETLEHTTSSQKMWRHALTISSESSSIDTRRPRSTRKAPPDSTFPRASDGRAYSRYLLGIVITHRCTPQHATTLSRHSRSEQRIKARETITNLTPSLFSHTR